VPACAEADATVGHPRGVPLQAGSWQYVATKKSRSFFQFLGWFGLYFLWESAWRSLQYATYGTDYTLDYITEGELAGYTLLTVPEPCNLILLGLGGLLLRRTKDNKGNRGQSSIK
jgi:hypothetical protein